MRTTLNIDETLLADFKQIAARSHRSLSSVIQDALREALAARAQRSPRAPLDEAARYVEALRSAPGAVTPRLADSHVDTFLRLCVEVNAKGNLVADAYLAAIAIELDALLVTTDRDFARFPGLRWRHPLG